MMKKKQKNFNKDVQAVNYQHAVDGSEFFTSVKMLLNYLTSIEMTMSWCGNYTPTELIGMLKERLGNTLDQGYDLRLEQAPTVFAVKDANYKPAEFAPLMVCPLCNGSGTVLNPGYTVGIETCPVCSGSRVIPMAKI